MPSGHGPRRARIACSDSAAKQLENITSEAEIHAVDRALVVISVDPDVGVPLPGDTVDPQLRHYTYEVDSVRVLYFVTALRTVVFVARTSPRCRPTSSSSLPADNSPGCAGSPAAGGAA